MNSFSKLNYDNLYTIFTYLKLYELENLLLIDKKLKASVDEVCTYFQVNLCKQKYVLSEPRMDIRDFFVTYTVDVIHPLGHLKLRAPHGVNFRNSAYFTYKMMINGNSWAEHKVHTRAIHDNGLVNAATCYKMLARKRIGFTAKVVSVNGKSYIDFLSVHRVRMYDYYISLRFIFTRVALHKKDNCFELETIAERGFNYNLRGSNSACFGHHYHIKESDCRVALQGDFIYLEGKSSFWQISKFGVKPYLKKCSVFATDRFTKHNHERSPPYQLFQIHDGYACFEQVKGLSLRILIKRNDKERTIFLRGKYICPRIKYLPEESLHRDCFIVSHGNAICEKIEV